MRSYFAYIRVSTARQGEHGSSLHEQRDAIVAFAARHELNIVGWFEERETAAKVGRREFTRMLAALKKQKADGVIFHKIDRSARNLKDWSVIQDLAEQDIDVRFTQESVNLGSNEGKLTGDFLAVISAHYIRNLREEVKKGMRGRLKQGLYPLQAPVGYLDQGGGKPKIPDPVRAPFVGQAFELYASGRFSLRALSKEMHECGFRSRSGKKVHTNQLAKILRNPFYIGIMRMTRSGESYSGVHAPIVSKALFDRVQDILDGKANARTIVHEFLLRRMIACAQCGYRLIGERQKGRVYYRCHICPKHSIREDAVETAIGSRLGVLGLTEGETAEILHMAEALAGNWRQHSAEIEHSISLQLGAVNQRMTRLMDVYLDGGVDRPMFEERKLALLMERKALEQQRGRAAAGEQTMVSELLEYLEPIKSLPLSYELANPCERRELLKTITSNLVLHGKTVAVELRSPFREIAELDPVLTGGPARHRPRTRAKKIFKLLVQYWSGEQEDRKMKDSLAAPA